MVWARSTARQVRRKTARRSGWRRTSSSGAYAGPLDAGGGGGDEVGGEVVEHALDGLEHADLFANAGKLLADLVVEAGEEGHGFADLFDAEDAGFDAVIEVGGVVADLVGEVDELGFERRALVEEVVAEFGMDAASQSRECLMMPSRTSKVRLRPRNWG